jgi:signal transduction histidine kinase
MLVFGGFLVVRATMREQDAMATLARNQTRIAAAAIEDELDTLRGRLFLLAGSLSLQTSDLSDFHARAKVAFDPMTVVLSSETGEEIVNTSKPYGESLPGNPDMEAIRYVAETRQPRVSGLSRDPITGVPAVTINVPVTRDSRLVYVLSLDISLTLPRILNELELPAGWVAAIFDRQGYIIARNRDPALYIGQPAHPEFFKQISSEDQGVVAGISREGTPLFTAFAHTRLGGWTVSAGMPRDVLLAPVRQTTGFLIVLGGATVFLAVGLAILIGRRIARPIVGLVSIAGAIGRGHPITLRPTGLAEANVVARALTDLDARLRDVAAEREASAAALGRSEQKYRNLAEDLARIDADRTALLNREVVAQENERKRIARELHDSLAQYLTALSLKLDTLGQTSASQLKAVSELRSLIGELGRAVNRMAWELRPVALDELGLRSAVAHYMEEWAEMARLQVDVEIDLAEAELPPAIEATLFRVLQEATTNVSRHAEATRVGVILEQVNGEVRLIVEDDGVGFPIDKDPSQMAGGRRLGLFGMRERLALVHGKLDVESEPGRGTTLFITIPLGQAVTMTRRDAA